jgi:ABC-type multidrug transport system fused ATPase/permease subunit
MINIIKLFTLLSKDEKQNSIFLIFVILLSAVLDVLGIASILPLVAILSNPNLIESNILINKIYLFLNINDPLIFKFYAGGAFFIFFILSMVVKALAIYFQLSFSLMCEYTMGKRLLQNYLNQPYAWFLNHHSSNLAKNVLSTVSQIINQGLLPLLNLISQTIVILFITTLLVLVDSKLTLIVGLTLGIFYGVTYLLFSNLVNRKGSERVKNDQDRYTALSNAFGLIKETKLGNLENFFIQKFSKPAKNFAKSQAAAQTISQLPRYLFEAIAFGGLLLIVLYLMRQSSNFIAILPILSLYIFAAYRLMPSTQQLYSSFISLRYVDKAIDTMYKIRPTKLNFNSSNKKIDFKKEISLKNITYFYPKSIKTNLNKISLKIFANTTVGVVGQTGSGKTTLIDIILGLLEPQDGIMKVDDIIIDKNNLSLWQNNIGYVPQQIFLIDDTLTSNIALGIDDKLIDHEVVEHVSKIANLHDFVINELPEKYNTIIGERGIRLSGGQRQRIGIARALYNNPNVLILDEATNSLDNSTERNVMNSLNNLRNKITIIFIAHRTNTIKKCDQIILMDNGKIIASGNYDELSNHSKEFNKLITSK